MYTFCGLFSGVGGIELGFEEVGFKATWSNEKDSKACETFRLNFDHRLIEGDIHKVLLNENNEYQDVLSLDFDILLGGFPCQAFSIAGERKGFEDERGEVFFSIINLLNIKKSQGKLPKAVFLENVKNLKSHDKGNTFEIIKNEIEKFGYKIKSEVLKASDFAKTPQGRERIYIVGFLDDTSYESFNFDIEKQSFSKNELFSELINDTAEDTYYYTKEKYPHYFTPELDLTSEITNERTFYQIRRKYIRELKNQNCPTLTANMGTGGHNVPLILESRSKKIRKLTPRECFNLQGYPVDYKLPNQSNGHLYKQAGNSVVVPVIKLIAEKIKYALDKNKS